jgi:pyruvate dehydrogenase E2 component (dihydrolipoamide acetyltransferase)
MRRTIAARLTEAKQTIPHFYLRREVKLDALMAFREQLNKQLEGRGVKLSVNDFIIKACAMALQAVPDANAVWAGDRMLRLKPSDVAVAVAVEGGLFTPVLRDADKKSLSALSAEMKDLATRAKTKKLAPHEYQGGSFAISQPWDDGGRELRRGHQPAAWVDPGGGRGDQEAGGAWRMGRLAWRR